MILLLDSTGGSKLRLAITNGRLRILQKKYGHPASRELLKLIDQLWRKNKKTVKDVEGIVVAAGPGPFSALRTACALSNAMSFALKIPAVGVKGEMTMKQLAEQGGRRLKRVKLGTPVVPFYGKKPNITRPPRR